MLRTVVMGLLLFSLFVLVVGCATQQGQKAQFDTKYSIELGRYLPVNDPYWTEQAQEQKPAAEGRQEGAPAGQ